MAVLLSVLVLNACTTAPLMPYTTDTTPLVLVPASEAGVQDRWARFREIFCTVLEARGTSLPDYRPCDQALVRVGEEPAGAGATVDLGPSRRHLVAAVVPGVGWDCFSNWLALKNTVAAHVRRYGYDQILIQVDSLSGSTGNARQIRDAIMQMPSEAKEPNLVLIGYSKGAPDILEAVVSYPEIRARVAAVVSIAGAIGGSPLAVDVEQSQLDLLRHWPGADCSLGDGGAIESLRPSTRRAWLAQHRLPHDFPREALLEAILRFVEEDLSTRVR